MKEFPMLQTKGNNFIVQHFGIAGSYRSFVLKGTLVAGTNAQNQGVKPSDNQKTLNLSHIQIIAKAPTGIPIV